MGNYRDRLDIIADILQVVRQNAKKTHIMYKANLSYKVLQRYLAEITGAQLVSFENNTRLFLLTERGQNFLEAYEKYSKTNRNMEKQLNEIATKRKLLEDLSAYGMY